MKTKIIVAFVALLAIAGNLQAKDFILKSPNGKIEITINVAEKVRYSVRYSGVEILAESPLAMSFSNGVEAGVNMKIGKTDTKTFTEKDKPNVRIKTENIETTYNQIVLRARNGYSLVFRAYNDAAAYRFETNFADKELTVNGETVVYNFANLAAEILFPEEESMFTHQERSFVKTKINDIENEKFCSHPMLVSNGKIRALITEVDLESYAGVYYKKNGVSSFSGIFPNYALDCTPAKKKPDRNFPVTKTADYIAKTKGARTYPWRVMLLTDSDIQLLESTTLYMLASPSRIADASWIKPGKVAWDWWNACNIVGVDFESGVNTATYKYFIDFAAANNLEYIILDEGWYDLKKGLLSVVPQIDMEELLSYGAKKNVGIILWTTWLALEKDMDAAMAQFAKWGIKGLKIDFMQRDDQWMVDWYYSTAKLCAEHKLLVDYHGSYKPTGLQRTYPNVLTFEGVKGLENCKWAENITPEHDLTLPFTRMVLGPMDYTPGAMRNVKPKEFKAVYNRPMSQTTRCHQLGMYVVYESPLQMLADAPTNYEKEPVAMQFLSQVPCVWDETIALHAELGEYVVMARRNGNTWYIGAMNSSAEREIEIDMNFLDENRDYEITSWADGINIKMNNEDCTLQTKTIKKNGKITLKLASGGGFAAIVK